LLQKSGHDLLRLIKQNPNTKDIPVIFLTSSAFSENEVWLFETGASDYISKPFKTYELLARIRAQLNIKGMQNELILKNRMLQDREFHLQQLVNEKIKEIEQITLTMVSALESEKKQEYITTKIVIFVVMFKKIDRGLLGWTIKEKLRLS